MKNKRFLVLVLATIAVLFPAVNAAIVMYAFMNNNLGLLIGCSLGLLIGVVFNVFVFWRLSVMYRNVSDAFGFLSECYCEWADEYFELKQAAGKGDE